MVNNHIFKINPTVSSPSKDEMIKHIPLVTVATGPLRGVKDPNKLYDRLADEGSSMFPYSRFFENYPAIIGNWTQLSEAYRRTINFGFYDTEEKVFKTNMRAVLNSPYRNKFKLIQKDVSKEFFIVYSEPIEGVFRHIRTHGQLGGHVTTSNRYGASKHKKARMYEFPNIMVPDLDYTNFDLFVKALSNVTPRLVKWLNKKYKVGNKFVFLHIVENGVLTLKAYHLNEIKELVCSNEYEDREELEKIITGISQDEFSMLMKRLYPKRSKELTERYPDWFRKTRYIFSFWKKDPKTYDHLVELRSKNNVQLETREYITDLINVFENDPVISDINTLI
jgi:hypothetical protein